MKKERLDIMDLIIGSHVSFKKDTQLVESIKEALTYGANTFMFYTGAPQNTARSSLDETKIKEGQKLMTESNIDIKNVIVHAPYIINLANPKTQEFAVTFLKEEVKRVEQLGITKMVLHPGSHVGVGYEEGIKNIINGLNQVIDKTTKVTILLETMAGKGSECGITFEQIKEIIDGVIYQDKVAVCLDTCHIHDAGYDLNNFDEILTKFDKIIGLDKLQCVHVNDSKNVISSHKDRHENIGFGNIGFDNLIKVIYHEKLKDVPKILETPYVEKTNPPYKFEIEMIKNKTFNKNLYEDINHYYK
jgi:deoxyribonuclease-4